ncbi:hypothetical protein QJV43_gp38 [Serratia phage Serbin]|uniref:Uncharacterized protein n=1 Tax=Serratia phage Serbin TaxID=2562181 RepID=A0A482MGT4_9CAUD|nr:hypothetical protein QJV43_gp38 [Serratia phage Serbin]QBQ72954.1 hypothetical protein CPT_Serbin_038 [Serratia phage Serbin]
MKYKARIVRRKGEIEVKVSAVFTEEEYEGIQRISDDVHVNTDTVRGGEYDLSLGYLRLLCYWAELWNNRASFPDIITNAARRRRELIKHIAERASRKRRKRK